jgi:hypothetical protein
MAFTDKQIKSKGHFITTIITKKSKNEDLINKHINKRNILSEYPILNSKKKYISEMKGKR